MRSQDHTQAFSLRTISLAATIALFTTMAMISALAQNAVPRTAREAATSPAFAPRLHPPAGGAHLQRPPSPRGPASPQDGVIYDNGPYNGTTDAWTINFGFAATESMTGSGLITGVSFVYWDASTSDLLTSVDMAVGSTSFGGTFQTLTGITNTFLGINQFGYALYQADVQVPGVLADAYITLQNACTTSGCSVSNPIYWDENSGIGCTSPGCPSLAYASNLGSIPSEAFSVRGGQGFCGVSDTSWFRAARALVQTVAQSFNVIYSFTGGRDGAVPEGLTIDSAGNFYGTTRDGGNTASPCFSPGCGTVYKLSHQDGNWFLRTLYRFSGADGSGPSSRATFGPDGTLYGVTWLGGSANNGTVYNLKPPVNACPNALCDWKEAVLYSFQGFSGRAASCSLQKPLDRLTRSRYLSIEASDGSEPSGDVVFDRAGNLYGTTTFGGTGGSCGCGFPCGLVYKLTPSGGGWGESILYMFQGGDDGGTPESGVILDTAGNLYGTTIAHGLGGGTVFRLTSQGLDVLHQFAYYDRHGSRPTGGLIHDQIGNFYGTTAEGGIGCGGCGCGTVFELAGSDTFTSLYSFAGSSGAFSGPSSSLVTDAAGNLYGTTAFDGAHGLGSVFKLTPSMGSWIFTDIYDFTGGADGYDPSGLTMDANGNLWGTTGGGGAHGHGVIFEITP